MQRRPLGVVQIKVPDEGCSKCQPRACLARWCRRPAAECDKDHTVPYDQGGKTCLCNLAPLCRRHHRAKQARGWHLEQPSSGTLIWTTPSGRRRTTYPSTYLE